MEQEGFSPTDYLFINEDKVIYKKKTKKRRKKSQAI
jgi:hypothetical protein